MNVCFTAPMRKLVKKHKAVKKGQLTPEVKRELFSMAGTPAGLYQLALTLQVPDPYHATGSFISLL